MATFEGATPELRAKYEVLCELKSENFVNSSTAFNILKHRFLCREISDKVTAELALSSKPSIDEVGLLCDRLKDSVEASLHFFAAERSTPQDLSLVSGHLVRALAANQNEYDKYSPVFTPRSGVHRWTFDFPVAVTKFYEFYSKSENRVLSRAAEGNQYYRFLYCLAHSPYPFLVYEATGEHVTFQSVRENVRYRVGEKKDFEDEFDAFLSAADIADSSLLTPAEKHDLLKEDRMDCFGKDFQTALYRVRRTVQVENALIDPFILYERAYGEHTLNNIQVQRRIAANFVLLHTRTDPIAEIKGVEITIDRKTADWAVAESLLFTASMENDLREFWKSCKHLPEDYQFQIGRARYLKRAISGNQRWLRTYFAS